MKSNKSLEFKRYHKKVFLPKLDYKKFLQSLPSLWVTSHCQHRLVQRRKYHLQVPSVEDLKTGELFEVYLSNDKKFIEKVCIRIHTKEHNSCYVVAKNGAIITTWACNENNKYDKVDYSIYETN